MNFTETNVGFIKAFEKSIQKINDILGEEWFISKTDKLVHYTNLDGLMGIIESGGFWLSDIRFLNDSEEYENGRIFVKNKVEEFLGFDEFECLKEIFEGALEKLQLPLERTYYICSFSENEDSLEQWRAYSNGKEGLALIFSNKSKEWTSPFEIHPQLTLTDVIYDNDIKNEIIKEILYIFLKEYTEDKGRDILGPTVWSEHLMSSLSMLFNVFKHNAFKSEEEVRMILHSGPVEKGTLKLKYRVTNERIIPYINSSSLYNEKFIEEYRTDKLPLEKIIIGPTSNKEIMIESIKVFLKYNGYEDVEIITSSIPFRG